MDRISIRTEQQLNPVADTVSALLAVVRPILQGLLYALKHDVVAEVGGHDSIKLFMLPRLYRQGDGDIGICFEYAIHDAVSRGEASVLERVQDALRTHCKVSGHQTASILFGAEKAGALQVIDTAQGLLTDDSKLLTGPDAPPLPLRSWIGRIAGAFRRAPVRMLLPTSIRGAWKADLFLGMKDTDEWVGASVKINPFALEAAPGLRIGIVPTFQGKSDLVRFDDSKQMVVCPVPYDAAFMEIFYSAWIIVRTFLDADAKVPKEVSLPLPAHRMVADILAQRAKFGVLEVIEALRPLAQPELLVTTEQNRCSQPEGSADAKTDTLIAPVSRIVSESAGDTNDAP